MGLNVPLKRLEVEQILLVFQPFFLVFSKALQRG
jgi:hypothetical protein